MVASFSRGGIDEDGLGEIEDFSVGHQSIDDKNPEISLSAILVRKAAFVHVCLLVPCCHLLGKG